MASAWTGGQYSLIRALTGLVALAWMSRHVTAEKPVVVALAVLGMVAAVLYTLGWRSRSAAVVLPLAMAGAASLTEDILPPDILLPAVTFIAVAVPPAPFGSWAARGRIDPGGSWAMPPRARRMVIGFEWLVCLLALSVITLRGYLGLDFGDADIALDDWRWSSWVSWAPVATFVLLGLVPGRLGGFAWVVLLAGMFFLLGPLAIFVLPLHLQTFDPAWVRRRLAAAPELVFYDGDCGLCHRTVRFLLAEDTDGRAFRFAPLQSKAFERDVSAEQRADLPDSLIVHTEDGRTLFRSDGIVHMLRALGGLWGVLGFALGLVPRWLRNRVYELVARYRRRFFRKPGGACPILPPHLRARFEV